ncbi:hypothetical protein LR48_Vigan306s000100 [Vigna angularis]|uniref:Uncharacterized protein n=1 Tax=Phaseolus angularis TaxID=3914 RepID=A0A0L9T9B6_PHAAN|nr:hypothetical protein LR48_Vigan306s000100 [Vigna angularis]
MLLLEEECTYVEGLTLEGQIVGNPTMSLSPMLDRNEKLEHYVKMKDPLTHCLKRVKLEELKKTALEKEEKTFHFLEPDEEEDEDIEKNPMKMSAKIVEKSPKIINELVKVIEKSSITKSVKALKRSTKVKDRRAIRKKKKSNLIERSKPSVR